MLQLLLSIILMYVVVFLAGTWMIRRRDALKLEENEQGGRT